MKNLVPALSLVLLMASPLAPAQEKKEPSAAQKKQQELMKQCNEKAGERKGDERKKFMSTCLKGDAPSAAQTKQQQRMAECNKQAGAKQLKGDERKNFMSGCLKG
jgi:psiF repeat